MSWRYTTWSTNSFRTPKKSEHGPEQQKKSIPSYRLISQMPWVWRCEFIGIQKSWLIVIIGIPKSWDMYFCGLWLPGKVLMDGVWGRMCRIQGRKQAPWVVPMWLRDASTLFEFLWTLVKQSMADSRTSQIYTNIWYLQGFTRFLSS